MTINGITVINPAHIEFIEENSLFPIAEFLGLKACETCATADILTVIYDDARVVTAHKFAGSAACPEIALCTACYAEWIHYELEVAEEFEGCNLCGAPAQVARADEDGDPYYFAYEGSSTVYAIPPSSEPTTGNPPRGIRLAGEYLRFPTEEARDAFVAAGPRSVQFSDGIRFHHRRNADYEEVRGAGLDTIVEEEE